MSGDTGSDRTAAPGAGAPPGARRRPWVRVLLAGVALLILGVLFTRVDVAALADVIARADVVLLLVALPLGMGTVVCAGLRWHDLLRQTGQRHESRRATVIEYWVSLAIGSLVPGTLGSDAVRMVAARRRGSSWAAAGVLVVIEKVGALAACAALFLSMLPLVPLSAAARLGGASNIGPLEAAIGVLACGGMLLGLRLLPDVLGHPLLRRALAGLRSRLGGAAAAVATDGPLEARPLDWPRLGWGGTATFLGWSLASLCISALQTQLFFVALGQSIPFAVNLLVTPLIFAILAVPITPAGLGVREAAFVVLYGAAAGVPAGTALLVGLLAFASTLLTQGVGAALMAARPPAAARTG